ncbi:MAG: hypothetical protein KIS67_12270 [Verrucomicrobiae bacterium]|nr:hypothetical protein [Verrucomicrobiae bacterium]
MAKSQCYSRTDYLTGQGSKLGIDATKKLPGEGFKGPWPPLIKMDESTDPRLGADDGKNSGILNRLTNSTLHREFLKSVKAKVEKLFNS